MITRRKKQHRHLINRKPRPAKRRAHYTTEEILEAARAYRKAGVSFYPLQANGSKEPYFSLLPQVKCEDGFGKGSWKPLQERRPSKAEIARWYDDFAVRRDGSPVVMVGMAVITGEISGGLEAIDFDDIEFFNRWKALIKASNPKLLDKLVYVRSPRPGMHVYYRCDEAARKEALAEIPVKDPTTGKITGKAVIELKGEGGSLVAPPSPRNCHPRRIAYQFAGTRDFTALVHITGPERALLHEMARDLSTYKRPLRQLKSDVAMDTVDLDDAGRPGDLFNKYATWQEVLEPFGWKCTGSDEYQKEYWTRPGKTSGTSATVNADGNDRLYVFTFSTELDSERYYTKFEAITYLKYKGDFKRAAAALRKLGYGRKQSQQHTGRRKAWWK